MRDDGALIHVWRGINKKPFPPPTLRAPSSQVQTLIFSFALMKGYCPKRQLMKFSCPPSPYTHTYARTRTRTRAHTHTHTHTHTHVVSSINVVNSFAYKHRQPDLSSSCSRCAAFSLRSSDGSAVLKRTTFNMGIISQG